MSPSCRGHLRDRWPTNLESLRLNCEQISTLPQRVPAVKSEAEAGYDVEQLRKRGRPTRGEQAAQVVPVRFTDEEISSLMQRADREHLNRSEAIRRAVREWTTA